MMNEIQLAQWRDIAIEYLPAAQQFREEVKARPTEDRESQSYAMGLWNIADKTMARHEATAAERVAAMVLQALSEWQLYAVWPRLQNTKPEPREAMLPGILNVIQTLKNITGCAISLDDPLVYFVEPITSAIDWSEYQQDARHQYLMGMPGDLDPWMLCDVWDIDTACQLITLGCKLDIEKKRTLKKLPVTAPHFHAFRARTICEVYDRAKSIAELSTMKNPDTRANWIKWAQGKGYSVAHLMPADAPAAKVEDKLTDNWMLLVQIEATTLWRELKKLDCTSPTKHSIKDDIAKICRKKEIKTDHGIYPTAEYIYRHVLRGWTPPTD